MKKIRIFLPIFVLLLAGLACIIDFDDPTPTPVKTSPGNTPQEQEEAIATISKIRTTVRQGPGANALSPVEGTNPLNNGDFLEVTGGGKGLLDFGNAMRITIFNDTTLGSIEREAAPGTPVKMSFLLKKGGFLGTLHPDQGSVQVNTPNNGHINVLGTTFFVIYEESSGTTIVGNFDGTVQVTSGGSTVSLSKEHYLEFSGGKPGGESKITFTDAQFEQSADNENSALFGLDKLLVEQGSFDEPEFTYPEGGFLEAALAGEFQGTTVTVDGPFADSDQVKFEESVQAFEKATGIDVIYIGGKEFEASINVRVQAGDAPDIADFPQPGLLANFVRQSAIIDVSSFIPYDWLQQQYNQSWIDMATVDGTIAGVFHRFNGKSLVWYPVDDFEAAGYEVPNNWEELIGLMDQIVADGDAPWCIGIESGAATGWPATDWIEEILLRTTSLENYDAWVLGELPFSSDEVRLAAEIMGEIWFNDEYVYGGRDAIISTNFGDSPAPMFEDPPRCWLHKQGNFITGFFPEGAQAGRDYAFFYLPEIFPEYGRPFLVAGDIMAMFNDRPEVRALMEYFTTPKSAQGWLDNGGALAAHQTATPNMYGEPLERGIAELVANATSFRFDGSDLMPGQVGAGAFWKAMTDWISGSIDLEEALIEIDVSWDQ